MKYISGKTVGDVILELTQGQADLLYNSLAALCLQYEEVIEKADTAAKKKLYQNYREKTLEIMRRMEKQSN